MTFCVPLAACGGGGGVNSTPSPAPAPAPSPTPTPTPAPGGSPIANLQSDHTFSGEATTTNVVVGTSDGVVSSSSDSSAAITVTYDAATKSYSVATEGRTQTFGPADAQSARWAGETRYAKTSAGGGEYLTLVTNPYSDPEFSNQYVGMGYWQRNALQGTDQQTYFSTFTYGFDTAAAAVPRTGTAHWLTDVFGLLSIPSKELNVVQGLGDFEVDFTLGVFKTSAYLDEADVVTNGGVTGSLLLESAGHLDSGHGFSGPLSYRGSSDVFLGMLIGSFYGPNADEIGATFNATDGNGGSLTGAMTGHQWPAAGTSAGIPNLSLVRPLSDERLFGPTVSILWSQTDGQADYWSLVHGQSTGSFDLALNGPGTINFNSAYTPDPDDLDPAGSANFDTYHTSYSGNPATIALYKVGSANQELALTYSSFGHWSSSEPGAIPTGETLRTFNEQYLVYGIKTGEGVLGAMTGSANYSGVVYGTGAAMNGTRYDVGGTSQFHVDFPSLAFDGSLQLHGTDAHGAATDFGTWTFTNPTGVGSATLIGPGVNDPGSSIQPYFFGPTGEEIGAPFWLATGWPADNNSVTIVGAAMAKRH